MTPFATFKNNWLNSFLWVLEHTRHTWAMVNLIVLKKHAPEPLHLFHCHVNHHQSTAQCVHKGHRPKDPKDAHLWKLWFKKSTQPKAAELENEDLMKAMVQMDGVIWKYLKWHCRSFNPWSSHAWTEVTKHDCLQKISLAIIHRDKLNTPGGNSKICKDSRLYICRWGLFG